MESKTLLTIAALLLTTPSFAEFHRCEDASGAVSFSDQPCKNSKGASQVQTKKKITESSIRALVKSLSRASNTKSLSGIMNHFTRNARITLKGFQEGNGTYNMSQYKQQIKEAWALPFKYKTDSEILSIDIAPSGMSAVVKSVVTDSVKSEGKVLASLKANQTVNVVASSGKPKIEKAVAVAF